MATLSKGKQTDTWWKPIRFCRISLLDSGSLVIFSSPSLGISSMAVGDGSPWGATSNSGGPAGIFRVMGGSKDNTCGSSSISAPGATASFRWAS
ncbi:hypothetical protein AVEN_49310-1 [Araneus ventricosus]|uniref:Uncharacterized protein n=1 Tax=Araneus ventricosus TaxID=182803 RepID=A0A4Y2R9X1_ARAVE|nr:hypothetical protein AVEN_49310-1 [Araneus ventricosus]